MDTHEGLFTKLRSLTLLVGSMVLALAACTGSKPNPSSEATTRSAPAPAVPTSARTAERAAANDIKQKFGRCTTLLMDSLQKPTAPFHFSYKADENINPKFPQDKTAKPEVGSVQLDGDFTPEEINFTTVRGPQKTAHKAAKGDDLAWATANLELIGPVTSTGMILAFGQLVAEPAGADTVGGVAADKYQFDTTTATGSTKMGMDIAKSMLTNIDSAKGMVWLEKSTGKLVKFNIDAAFADTNSHAWKEHYEGEVVPK